MPRGVTEQDVFEAADALLARGERPTIDRVRQELGSGSPNTVNPHLDAWWKALGKRVGGVQSAGLPSALLQACTRFYEDIKIQALNEVQGAVDEFQHLAKDAQLALEAVQAAMVTEKAVMQSSIETLREELTRTQQANQALTRQVAQQQADVEAAQGHASVAAEQLKRAQDGHERAAAAARTEMDRIREQWQGNEKRWLGEIDHLREEVKRLRGEHDRTQKSLLGRIQDLEQQLSDGAKERAALRVVIDSAQRELAGEREKRSFAEGALTASRKSAQQAPSASRRRKMSAKP